MPKKSGIKRLAYEATSLQTGEKHSLVIGHMQDTQTCWLVLRLLSRLRCSVAKTPVAVQLSVCPSLLICCLSTGHTLIL